MSKDEYKEKIIELVNKLGDVEKLRFIYIFLKTYTEDED